MTAPNHAGEPRKANGFGDGAPKAPSQVTTCTAAVTSNTVFRKGTEGMRLLVGCSMTYSIFNKWATIMMKASLEEDTK
jgi:hypothetical protein